MAMPMYCLHMHENKGWVGRNHCSIKTTIHYIVIIFYVTVGVSMADAKAHTNQVRVKGINEDFCDKLVNSPVPLPIGSSKTK